MNETKDSSPDFLSAVNLDVYDSTPDQKMECLRLALRADPLNVLKTAKEYFAWVSGTEPRPEPLQAQKKVAVAKTKPAAKKAASRKPRTSKRDDWDE
jgi:hypothetical protein